MKSILRALEDLFLEPEIIILLILILMWSFAHAAMSDDIKEMNKKLDTIQEQLNSIYGNFVESDKHDEAKGEQEPV